MKNQINIKTEAGRGKIRKSDQVLRIKRTAGAGIARFGVGAVDGQNSAYVYPLAVTFCANPEFSSGAKAKKMLAASLEHEVKTGTVLKIDGKKYTCRVVMGDSLRLKAV